MHTAFLQLALACSSDHRRSICNDDRMFSCSHVQLLACAISGNNRLPVCVRNMVGKVVEDNAEYLMEQESLRFP